MLVGVQRLGGFSRLCHLLRFLRGSHLSLCVVQQHYLMNRRLKTCNTGIGQAIYPFLLAQQPNHKLLVVARTHAALDQLCYQYPNSVEVLAADLSDLSRGAKAVELAGSRWGRLDAVIVNHGTLDPVKKVADLEAEDWRKAFDVNVFSAIAVVSIFILPISMPFASCTLELSQKVTE